MRQQYKAVVNCVRTTYVERLWIVKEWEGANGSTEGSG